MTDNDEPDESSESGTSWVEVTGRMSRADWEDFYLTTRKLAIDNGLNVQPLELRPTQPEAAESDPGHTGETQDTGGKQE